MIIRCPTCGGSGLVNWSPPPNAGSISISPWPTECCRSCGGSGWVEQQQQVSQNESMKQSRQ